MYPNDFGDPLTFPGLVWNLHVPQELEYLVKSSPSMSYKEHLTGYEKTQFDIDASISK